MNEIRIGTSGFSYKDWLGNFYPQFCPQADFLKYYTSRFDTVELDVTFYRIPSEAAIKKWYVTAPESFVFAAKFPQTVTHEGTPKSRIEFALQFVQAMRGLKEKLGPLLLQFPYGFKPTELPLLEQILDALPTDLQLCVEIRNRAWLQESFYAMLRKRGIALCLVEHPWMPHYNVKTADFQYVRFLGDHKTLTEDFSYVRDPKEDVMRYWRDILASYREGGGASYVYFNNHFTGHAPTNAFRLMELLAAGL